MWLNKAVIAGMAKLADASALEADTSNGMQVQVLFPALFQFMRPKRGIKIEWSNKFAYALGLLATDGNLSPDSRHIVFTSKDEDLIFVFKKSLEIDWIHVGKKSGGKIKEKKYFVVQIGNVIFYRFLNKIGIGPKKSKVLKKVDIPKNLFIHFLRGCIDGDGSIVEYLHPQSKILQLKTRLYSGSKDFLIWIKQEVEEMGVLSKIFTDRRDLTALVFYKTESKKLQEVIFDQGITM